MKILSNMELIKCIANTKFLRKFISQILRNSCVLLLVILFPGIMNARSEGANLVDITIQYNNKADRQSDDALTLNDFAEKKVAFDEMLNNSEFYGSGDITLQVVFYDRTILGPFQLKDAHKNMSAEEYVDQWQTQHTGEKRILMLFVKKNPTGSYNFTTFEVSDLPHIFPVVEKYIQQQIMKQSATHTQTVNDGLNALKNAYDDGKYCCRPIRNWFYCSFFERTMTIQTKEALESC